MGKILRVLKVNFFALLALPLFLLAVAAKLISKSMEKLPILIGLIAAAGAFLWLAGIGDVDMGDTITWFFIAIFGAGVLIAILVAVIVMLANLLSFFWSMLTLLFDSIYALFYNGYLHMYAFCEADYQILSLNGKKMLNALVCPVFTILRALSWGILTLISLVLPIGIIASIALVAGTGFSLNYNTKAAFGLNIFQYAGSLSAAALAGGLFIYLVVMSIGVLGIMSFALEWHEWANDLKMNTAELADEIGDLQGTKIQMGAGEPDKVQKNLEYLNMLSAHVEQLDSLGQRVQDILDKKDDALLRNSWSIYMRNLQELVAACSGRDGVSVDKLKKLIPRIQKLDRQRDDVRKAVDKLAEQMKNPAGSSVFFAGCDNLEKLEKRYKSLCKAYHPDSAGGDTETFQKMQEEYESVKSAYSSQQADLK